MIRHIFAAIMMVLLLVPVTGATVVQGLTLPDEVTVDGQQLVLNGAGLREKKFLFIAVDVYVAGLYLKSKSSDARAIINADETMMLKIKVINSHLTGQKFRDATLMGFEESTGGHTAPIKKEINMFLKAFSDEIDKGDEFDIQYVKDKGVQVYKNERANPQVVIPGLEIKKALFGIWLGKRSDPYLQVLARHLLGK